MKPTFYQNAMDRGLDLEKIQRIWKVIEDAGLYSFNQAHAISYGILTYISAWVKIHYPLHFMANTLTMAYEAKKDAKKIQEMIEDCQRQGIQFLPVDINKSEWEFTVENGKIRIGFCAVKAFGEGAAKDIISIRPIFSFGQVLEKYNEKKVQLNKKALGGLVCLDAFEGLVPSHYDAFRQMAIIKGKTKAERAGNVIVEPIFSPCVNCEIDIEKTTPKDVEELLLKTNFMYRPGATLPPAHFNSRNNGDKFTAMVEITKTKKHKDKRGNDMVFLDLAASDGTFDGVIFGSTYAKINKKIVRKGKCLKVEGKKDNDSCIIFSVEEVAA